MNFTTGKAYSFVPHKKPGGSALHDAKKLVYLERSFRFEMFGIPGTKCKESFTREQLKDFKIERVD